MSDMHCKKCGCFHYVKNGFGVWRTHDPCSGRTLARELGRRDAETARKLLDKVGIEGKTFVTDDWEGCHRVISKQQLFTGKDLTFPSNRTIPASATTLPGFAEDQKLPCAAATWLTVH